MTRGENLAEKIKKEYIERRNLQQKKQFEALSEDIQFQLFNSIMAEYSSKTPLFKENLLNEYVDLKNYELNDEGISLAVDLYFKDDQYSKESRQKLYKKEIFEKYGLKVEFNDKDNIV